MLGQMSSRFGRPRGECVPNGKFKSIQEEHKEDNTPLY